MSSLPEMKISKPSLSHQEAATSFESKVNLSAETIACAVAYMFCLEIDLAIENGIRLADQTLLLQKSEESVVDIERKTETLLKCVENFIGKALSFPSMSSFQERVAQMLSSKEEELSKFKQPYKIFPGVAIESTDLPESFHQAACFMIQTVFCTYRTEIDKGLSAVHQGNNFDFQNSYESSLEELIKIIHSHVCQTEVDAGHLQQEMMKILTEDRNSSSRMEEDLTA